MLWGLKEDVKAENGGGFEKSLLTKAPKQIIKGLTQGEQDIETGRA